MKQSLVLAVLVVLSAFGCDKLRGKQSVSASGTAAVAADSMKVDKVSNKDGAIAPDGEKDGAVTLTVDGPIAGIVLVTTDKDGNPEGGQQWDTYTANQKVPAAIKAPYDDGGPTWQLGVFENGKALNGANGALSTIPAGPHKLALYASDSGYFTKDNHFVVFVERADHGVVRSNVFTF